MDAIITTAVRSVEFAGIGAILIGAAAATLIFLASALTRTDIAGAFRRYRQNLGRAILLGLELLVAADIINTVALEPTLRSVAVLGGIVLVRTFLSFALEVELEGRWPWNRADGSSAGGRA